jgi:hypothetical protein
MAQVVKIASRGSARSQCDPDPLHELPSPEIRYWVPRHKVAVVAAVQAGSLTIDEACKRYMLSQEEFQSWKTTIDQYGVVGLRATPRERRRTPRQAVSAAGTASLYADTAVECIITNISDVGARLRFGVALQLPSTFELHCKKSGRSWLVTPVWQNERTTGVRFSNPLHPPWTVKSGLADWLLGKRRTVVIDKIDGT